MAVTGISRATAITTIFAARDWITNQSCSRAAAFFSAGQTLGGALSAAPGASELDGELADKSDMVSFVTRAVAPVGGYGVALDKIRRLLSNAAPRFSLSAATDDLKPGLSLLSVQSYRLVDLQASSRDMTNCFLDSHVTN